MTSLARSATSCVASVFDGPDRPFRLERITVPALSRGEVLVRVICCTICGSDLHTFHGRRSAPAPSILGHETIGVIQELKDAEFWDHNGHLLQPGDRVTWSIAVSCGDCFFCSRDLTQKCERVFKYGHQRLDGVEGPAGGLSEFCVLRRGTAIFRIPDEVSDLAACPASCATATVVAAVRYAGELAGETVLVQGAGMLGITACALASVSGAAQIIVMDPDPARLSLAREFGATLAIDPSAEPEGVGEHIRELTHGRGVDVAFEFSGVSDSVELALTLLRNGGRYVLAGAVFPSRPLSISAETVVRGLLRIQGLHNYAAPDLGRALEFLARHGRQHKFERLVSRTFPLSRTTEAFRDAGEERLLRVAIIPD
jgi:putative phosphonate catabolism associated alcohol dehydrogenase